GPRGDRVRRPGRRAGRDLRAGHRSRHQPHRDRDAVPTVPARPRPAGLLLLRYGPGARDHAPAGRGAGLVAAVRDPRRLGDALLLRAPAPGAHRICGALERTARPLTHRSTTLYRSAHTVRPVAF